MRFIFFIIFLLSSSLATAEVEKRPVVLVSVAPYRYFVHQIANDLLEVHLMVPPGASAHTYEPTAKEMIQATGADVWFRLGEPFENRAIAALKSANANMEIVDLRLGVPLLHSQCKHAHAHSGCGEDLHLWLSPRLAKIQAQTISEALSHRYPAHKDTFQSNLKKFLVNLDQLDRFVFDTLAPVQNRTLMVSHPAYAYFCQDYRFNQLSIEFEGKDPTSKQLTTLLQNAQKSNVHVIFTQPQYSDKAARLIAKQIGAKLISLDPYAEDYENTLRFIAKQIADNR